jgi:phosphoglycerate dehydrogenase-like enzyme
MLILQTVRAATEAEKSVRQGHWSYNLGRTPDVRDLVVGIIGMGTIGKVTRLNVLHLNLLLQPTFIAARAEQGRTLGISGDIFQ